MNMKNLAANTQTIPNLNSYLVQQVEVSLAQAEKEALRVAGEVFELPRPHLMARTDLVLAVTQFMSARQQLTLAQGNLSRWGYDQTCIHLGRLLARQDMMDSARYERRSHKANYYTARLLRIVRGLANS
jgi:hypothetical protein